MVCFNVSISWESGITTVDWRNRDGGAVRKFVNYKATTIIVDNSVVQIAVNTGVKCMTSK